MSQTVRLRALTEKSKIGWGKFANNTVGELLAARKSNSLVWLYYNVQWINFTEDVLLQIPIYESERIQKPGINPDAYDKYMYRKNKWRHGDKTALVLYQRNKKRARQKAKRVEENTTFSKTELQSFNHGHAKPRIFRK